MSRRLTYLSAGSRSVTEHDTESIAEALAEAFKSSSHGPDPWVFVIVSQSPESDPLSANDITHRLHDIAAINEAVEFSKQHGSGQVYP